MIETPIAFILTLESLLVGLVLGVSTIAVISYPICLIYRYPQKGTVGFALIQSVYTILRLVHIFLVFLVGVVLILYGVFDGSVVIQFEYGIKCVVLLLNAVYAFGMAQHVFRVRWVAPMIAAGWYFLASFHLLSTYSVLTVDSFIEVVFVIVMYCVYLGVFQGVFFAFDSYFKGRAYR